MAVNDYKDTHDDLKYLNEIRPTTQLVYLHGCCTNENIEHHSLIRYSLALPVQVQEEGQEMVQLDGCSSTR